MANRLYHEHFSMKEALIKFFGLLLFKGRHIMHNAMNRMAYLVFTNECPDHRELFVEYPVSLCGGRYMKIGNNFRACANLRLECIDGWNGELFSPKLTIGNNVTLHYRCHIGCINSIVIGNNVLMGSNVFITDHSHGTLEATSKDISWIRRPLLSKGGVVIKDDVWIGENVTILPGVTIGEGSIVGANSVVTHSVPPYSIAAGNPAKVVRQI